MQSTRSLVASAGQSPNLNIGLNHTSPGDFTDMLVLSRLSEFPFSTSFSVESWEDYSMLRSHLEGAGGQLVRSHESCSVSELFEGPDGEWLTSVYAYDGFWSLTYAAKSSTAIQRFRESVFMLAGEPSFDDDVVSMSIWSEHPMGGGLQRYGQMKVGVWEDVMDNYSLHTREALEGLAAGLPDRSAGGIVLFAGPAGTGKTRAIEALCHAWAKEAKLGVVVDTDRMLGSANYMTDVLTSAGADRRQVIVAEDADRMLSVGDKSDETSKLLNIADGLVGRLAGAGTLFVLSVNIPVKDVATYITRPGRCAAVVEFSPLDVSESNAWLSKNGASVEVDCPMTLAELYRLLSDSTFS